MGQYVPFDPGEEPPGSFIHNFRRGNYPYENVQPEGLYREARYCYWKMTEIDFVKNVLRFSGTQLRLYCERKSKKRLQQTHEEFFGEIDRTIVEVGLTIAKVTERINIHLYFKFDVNKTRDIMPQKNLDAFLIPIYIVLRKKGYNKEDFMG